MTVLHCRSPYGAAALSRRINRALPGHGACECDNDVYTTAPWGLVRHLVDDDGAFRGVTIDA